MTRSVLGACAVAALVVSFVTGCGASAKASSSQPFLSRAEIQREVAYYRIDQIEKTFHRALSTHDLNLMMSLWAPGATFNIGTDAYAGKAAIRRFFATKNPAFRPQNHWISDTPTYKIKISVYGDRATLYMECHLIDVKTGKIKSLVGVDHNLQKIDGRWLIVDGAASAATLG
jgi:ketosteroid isomerase-like protein